MGRPAGFILPDVGNPSEAEAILLAREDAEDAIDLARNWRSGTIPVRRIALGADRDESLSSNYQERWWQQKDERWPKSLREIYNTAFIQELARANVVMVQLRHETWEEGWIETWSDVGVVDLERWEPTFPLKRGEWAFQTAETTDAWRRRTIWRRLLARIRG